MDICKNHISWTLDERCTVQTDRSPPSRQSKCYPAQPLWLFHHGATAGSNERLTRNAIDIAIRSNASSIVLIIAAGGQHATRRLIDRNFPGRTAVPDNPGCRTVSSYPDLLPISPDNRKKNVQEKAVLPALQPIAITDRNGLPCPRHPFLPEFPPGLVAEKGMYLHSTSGREWNPSRED